MQGSLKETKKESEDFLTTAERKSKQAFDTVQKKTKQLTSDHGKKSQSNKKSGEKESDNSDTTQEIKDSLVKGKQYLENKADQVQQKFQQKQKKQALGKYLTKNIISPEDKVIAKRGDMITHQVMKKAENDNLLDQVLNHTSVSQPSQTS